MAADVAAQYRGKRMAGIILFEGSSALDGAPIVIIATDNTSNAKTGDMVQTWILRADVPPHVAARDGRDASICGACPHRFDPATGKRTCYVATWRAPLSVFNAYKRGAYPRATPAQARAFARGRMVRLGAYGDPLAGPLAVWRNFTREAAGRTGYTHAWQTVTGSRAIAWRGLVMASADSIAEAEAAHAAGWRTFRVRRDDYLMPTERVCPASAEAGKVANCAQCRACNGADGRRSLGIAIVDHGPGWRQRVAA
jgi:hypothetical protein